ncbi:MAG: GAF domain-containing protein, partial [Actinomycetota bacterium]|nr:GAF domain-containing protein [Actinomycetota bacterium]
MRLRNRTTDDHHGTAVSEARANVDAVTAVVTALSRARTTTQAVAAALDEVRQRFGWAYGSYWRIDDQGKALRFVQESGDAGDEFRRVTMSASFKEGVGLSGRAWKSRDLVFVPDLGEVRDCVRAPAAQRVGVRSGICFPLLEDGRVTGTMDFFATETLALSEQRLATLRAIAVLVSQALERKATTNRQAAALADMAAVNQVLRQVSTARTRDIALSQALDTIRTGFG